MNPLHGSEAGNSVIDGATEVSSPQTTALQGVVPHPAAAVDRYMATGAWGTRSLPTAFRQAATTYAGRTALITPDTRLTYRELDARSDAVAARLLGSGLLPGERVLLQLTNSATAVVAWYGLLKAGLIPVCTLAIHRRLEIEQIGRQSGAVAHLVQADFPSFDLVGLAHQVAGLLPAMRQLLTVGAAPENQACESRTSRTTRSATPNTLNCSRSRNRSTSTDRPCCSSRVAPLEHRRSSPGCTPSTATTPT